MMMSKRVMLVVMAMTIMRMTGSWHSVTVSDCCHRDLKDDVEDDDDNEDDVDDDVDDVSYDEPHHAPPECVRIACEVGFTSWTLGVLLSQVDKIAEQWSHVQLYMIYMIPAVSYLRGLIIRPQKLEI